MEEAFSHEVHGINMIVSFDGQGTDRASSCLTMRSF